MRSRQLAGILNKVLHAEQRSIIPRLPEFQSFVSWASADEMQMVQGMIAESAEHITWLADAIDVLGETPTPYQPDIHLTSMHYCNITALMPLIVEDCRSLIRTCEAALPAVASDPKAAALLARILARHQAHLTALEQLNNSVPSS